ncbi:hypothetical protein HN51_056261 [Arachis hypogaea]
MSDSVIPALKSAAEELLNNSDLLAADLLAKALAKAVYSFPTPFETALRNSDQLISGASSLLLPVVHSAIAEPTIPREASIVKKSSSRRILESASCGSRPPTLSVNGHLQRLKSLHVRAAWSLPRQHQSNCGVCLHAIEGQFPIVVPSCYGLHRCSP